MTPPRASSPLLLAMESASRTASVALLHGETLLGTRTSNDGQHHAETLLPQVASLLDEAAVKPADIDAFAVGIGPGAFTSIRIGVATIKGLAFGSDRPIAPVSTLAAIAQTAFAEYPGFAHIVAVLDARRGEVYTAEFGRGSGDPSFQLVRAEALGSAATIAATADRGAGIAGELPPRFGELLAEADREDLELLPPSLVPRALAVASLGRVALAAGETTLARQLTPQYLRRPEAEETRLAAASAPQDGPSA